jgi:heme exporter protein D
MVSQALAYWTPGLPELMLVFLMSGFWLLLIILPIVYVVHSVKTRRRILTEIDRLAAEVRSLRRQVEGGQKPTG